MRNLIYFVGTLVFLAGLIGWAVWEWRWPGVGLMVIGGATVGAVIVGER